ncbi:MAG TPA: DUF2207 domain-containing protein, partial [bacterium]
MFRKILLKGVLSAACVVSLLSDGALAKSYDLNKVIIMSRIGADGSLRIEESRTYQFQGRFSWADYHLPLKQLGTVEDFSIREGSQMYDARGDEEPGTYQTRISDNEFYAKWFYQARDETRTFVLNYTVTPAVNKYADVAEFYYKFVGEANPTRIDTVEVTIQLPQTADTTFTRAWAHGALWGDLRFENGDVKMSVSPLPAHQYWEVRVVFPNNWIGEALPTIGEAALPAILADEAKWARTANEQRRQELQRLRQSRENEKKAWPIAVGALALGLLGVAFLYFSFGRGFHVPYQQKIDSNMPRDLHPALASFLYFQKQMTGNALMATVLHLAEKGVIKIEEGATSPKRRFGSRTPHFLMKLVNANWRSDTSLLDFEISLLGFLFDDLGNGVGQIEFDDLKKNQKKVRRWFEGWQRLVKAH